MISRLHGRLSGRGDGEGKEREGGGSLLMAAIHQLQLTKFLITVRSTIPVYPSNIIISSGTTIVITITAVRDQDPSHLYNLAISIAARRGAAARILLASSLAYRVF